MRECWRVVRLFCLSVGVFVFSLSLNAMSRRELLWREMGGPLRLQRTRVLLGHEYLKSLRHFLDVLDEACDASDERLRSVAQASLRFFSYASWGEVPAEVDQENDIIKAIELIDAWEEGIVGASTALDAVGRRDLLLSMGEAVMAASKRGLTHEGARQLAKLLSSFQKFTTHDREGLLLWTQWLLQELKKVQARLAGFVLEQVIPRIAANSWAQGNACMGKKGLRRLRAEIEAATALHRCGIDQEMRVAWLLQEILVALYGGDDAVVRAMHKIGLFGFAPAAAIRLSRFGVLRLECDPWAQLRKALSAGGLAYVRQWDPEYTCNVRLLLFFSAGLIRGEQDIFCPTQTIKSFLEAAVEALRSFNCVADFQSREARMMLEAITTFCNVPRFSSDG